MSVSTFLSADATIAEAEALSEFYRTFDASLDLRTWITLCEEEADEVTEAIVEYNEDPSDKTMEALLKELADFRYVIVGYMALVANHTFSLLSEQTMARVMIIDQAAEEIIENNPVDFSSETLLMAFFRVHSSNMSKLGEDGKPIRREDGKILKGPNYKAPDLSDLIVEQVAA